MEIELKFALSSHAPHALAQQLAALPLLARRKARQTLLHNTYFDTADQQLRGHKLALRVRQIDSAKGPQWVQTLKLSQAGPGADSALSQRGEWESALPTGRLDPDLLRSTPWPNLDPDGKLFAALQPQFVVRFLRTSWTITLPDGGRVELALDVGSVDAAVASAPICELEMELLSGTPDVLFSVARHVAQTVSLVPLHWSKAERGYQLAQGSLDQPLRARAVPLTTSMPLRDVAACTLRDMLLQFTANLNHLRSSDAPEVLHQARIGWRRLRCGLWLFGKHPDLDTAPAISPLRPLVQAMARLRDLEVAAFQTLPTLADAFISGKARRKSHWKRLEQGLADAVTAQRAVALQALDQPAVGATLVALTRWLELELPSPTDAMAAKRSKQPSQAAAWVLRRFSRLHTTLQHQAQVGGDAQAQHRIRILAKRLRYGVEAVRPLLPKGKAQRWHEWTTMLQQDLGTTRDMARAADIVAGLQVDAALVAFVQGVALGMQDRRSGP